MSFDSLTIYCLATGKPIAAINEDETGAIIDSLTHIPLAKQEAHLERLALLSMRPSILWMTTTPESIESMRANSPRQLLAYLLNRTYAPLERPNDKRLPDTESMLACRRQRIANWEAIEHVSIPDDQLDSLLLVLLAIDSRYNLSKIVRPANLATLPESWTEDGASELILRLWNWHNALARKAADDARRAKAQAEWWGEGNRVTRQAYAAAHAKVAPTQLTPKQAAVSTAKAAKEAKLRDSVDFLDELERELTNGNVTVPSPIPAAPINKPSANKPILRFMAKK